MAYAANQTSASTQATDPSIGERHEVGGGVVGATGVASSIDGDGVGAARSADGSEISVIVASSLGT